MTDDNTADGHWPRHGGIRVQGPGRCTGCSWHAETQGHHPECTGGTVEPIKTTREVAAELLAKGARPLPHETDMQAEYDGILKAQAEIRKLLVKAERGDTEPGRAYYLAALRGEAEKVAETLAGSRNDRLNAYTFKLRRKYVDSGDLTTDDVAQAMFDAAVACGHVRDDGRGMAIGSIASGLGVAKGDLQWLR